MKRIDTTPPTFCVGAALDGGAPRVDIELEQPPGMPARFTIARARLFAKWIVEAADRAVEQQYEETSAPRPSPTARPKRARSAGQRG